MNAHACGPFYCVLANETTSSGLGPSIVSTVVQRLGWEVEPGEAGGSKRGLRVTVQLPQA